MGGLAQITEDMAIATETAGSVTTGYSSFNDFVQQNDYQYGPHFSSEALQQNPNFAHGGVDHNKVYAMSIAKNISALEGNAVALNQTINTAIVALAERDPNDPNSGSVHYVAFVQDRNSRTYVFTENITINPDGTIESQMEQAQGWDATANDEQAAYGNLVERFSNVAGSASGAPSLVAAFEKSSGRDLALGGVKNHTGEYEVRHEADGGSASVASYSDLNKTTGVELKSSYSPSGASDITMTIFRVDGVSAPFNASAEGLQIESTAPGVDNKAKFESFSQMTPGVNTLSP